MSTATPGQRLEAYTLKYPQEVLLVDTRIAGEEDCVAIFRGFSSSLMRPTAFDPDVPVLPAEAEIIAIHRLQGPYHPDQPHYLERDLPWAVMDDRLQALGL